MQTITRIHIARVPYNIETTAETRLQHYLAAIRASLDEDTADDVMQDIELRITELLAERQVKRSGTITLEDVKVVEAHLGKPSQISDADEPEHEAPTSEQPRRLLRDTDHAIFGGVASGLSAYFAMDVNIVRLIFVLLTLLSGLGLLIYLVLWLLVPAATTNAEKLEMHGRAVTAASLQSYRRTMSRTLRWWRTTAGKAIVRTTQIIASTVTVSIAIGIAAGLAAFTSVYCMQPVRGLAWHYHTTWFALGLVWLLGLACVVLLIVLTRQFWSRARSGAVRLASLVSLAAAVVAVVSLSALTPLIADHYDALYGNGKTVTALPVSIPAPTVPVTTLVATGDSNLQLNYVVTDQPIHAAYVATPGMTRPDLHVTVTGNTIAVNAQNLTASVPTCIVQAVCRNLYLPVHVVVYGPGLQQITSNDGASIAVDNMSGSLGITASNGSNVTLTNSTFSQLNIDASHYAQILAPSSSAQNAKIKTDNTATVVAPVITGLTALLSQPCSQSDGTDQPTILLSNTPTVVNVNGQTLSQTNGLLDLGERCITTDNTND